MPRKYQEWTDELYSYLVGTTNEPEIARALRLETEKMPQAGMQISPDQGCFLHFLVKLTGARQALEVGTFTGYSALWTALALPDDGKLIACDISDEWPRLGEPYWRQAGVDGKIDLRIGPGAETLQALLHDGRAGSFDFAFIDADKTAYDTYYELCLELLRAGGLIAVDNVLWHGAIADPEKDDPSTLALRALNDKITRDPRADSCLNPIGDGLFLARKR